MILYCDTSAVVKLYIAEADSDLVQAQLERAEAVATSRITWAEFHAAVARRAREVPADAPALEQAKQALADDWARYLRVEISQAVVETAGQYADAFALRGYDAVHLACARHTMIETGQELMFACFDLRLCRAAGLLDMTLLAS